MAERMSVEKEGLPRVLMINDDLKLHLYGTELIFEGGLMLQIPQITIAIAQQIYVCNLLLYL